MANKESEKYIEKHLRKLCISRGWLCEKFTSPNKRSVPDRMISAPGGTVVFVEVKSKGKKPTPLQTIDHKTRASLGCIVFVIDSVGMAEKVIQFVTNIVQRRTNNEMDGAQH